MYLHSIELQLAMASPQYKQFSRKDSLAVLQDAKANWICNGGFQEGELPEIVLIAGTFNEFYEGALGAYSTHTVFGVDTFAGIHHVEKIAEAVGWKELSSLLAQLKLALEAYPESVLQDYAASMSANEDVCEQLGILLVEDFAALVEHDTKNTHEMRRRAHEWVVSQLDSGFCDDENSMPLLPGTIEAARNQLGLKLAMPSTQQWREALATWQAANRDTAL